jgi:hypothetical protein
MKVFSPGATVMLMHQVAELYAAIRRLPHRSLRWGCRALVLLPVLAVLLINGLLGWGQLVRAAWYIRRMDRGAPASFGNGMKGCIR